MEITAGEGEGGGGEVEEVIIETRRYHMIEIHFTINCLRSNIAPECHELHVNSCLFLYMAPGKRNTGRGGGGGRNQSNQRKNPSNRADNRKKKEEAASGDHELIRSVTSISSSSSSFCGSGNGRGNTSCCGGARSFPGTVSELADSFLNMMQAEGLNLIGHKHLLRNYKQAYGRSLSTKQVQCNTIFIIMISPLLP